MLDVRRAVENTIFVAAADQTDTVVGNTISTVIKDNCTILKVAAIPNTRKYSGMTNLEKDTDITAKNSQVIGMLGFARKYYTESYPGGWQMFKRDFKLQLTSLGIENTLEQDKIINSLLDSSSPVHYMIAAVDYEIFSRLNKYRNRSDPCLKLSNLLVHEVIFYHNSHRAA